MMRQFLEPFIEGFKGSFILWRDMALALLSVFTVMWNFVNETPRPAEGDSAATD